MVYTYNLAQKFKAVANLKPSAPAIISEESTIAYGELDARSDALAANLRGMGVGVGDVVCIAGEKTIAAIISILAVLKSGAAYSLFDPENPTERLSKTFDQCRPKLVLSPSHMLQMLRSTGAKVIDYQTADRQVTPEGTAPPLSAVSTNIKANHPAYIMFTSGSTGVPKGATITHQNVLNLIAWSTDHYNFVPEDVLTNVNPLFFDNSVFDLYSALFSGASLALFTGATVRNPDKLMRLINEYKCTSWFSVPSMLQFLQTMRAFSPDNMRYVKRIIFGGEGYPKAKLKHLFDVYGHRATFYNVYGPTECTCICSSYEVSADDFSDLRGFLPLGHLIPNFDYLICDDSFHSVPPGHTGELILRGPNVGLGYYGNPERTRSSFIQNPTSHAYNETVYRTGDLVYLNPDDAKIYIVGRRDNQIKHMGYRIELEEIENALSCVDSVSQCAVVHCELRGFSQLVAFITSSNGPIEEDRVRCRLQQTIPHYMIPTRFEIIDRLPTNANGKLDRQRLLVEYLGNNSHG